MPKTLDRITRDPDVMNGQPCIRGMRITVGCALEAMAAYPDRQELFRTYPELDEEDLRQALVFAATSLEDQHVAKDIVRGGLRFPLGNDDYQVATELGQELRTLNQEMIDAKNRQTPAVSSKSKRTGR
jgi:uncharacterized protein (DUF433 family)